MKAVQKYPRKNFFLLALKLRPFKSYVKEEHSADKKFQSLIVQGKQLLKDKSL